MTTDQKINAIYKMLHEQQQKSTWVSARWITKLTGWTNQEMRDAREQNIVQYKLSGGGGYLYRLESLPDDFKRKVA